MAGKGGDRAYRVLLAALERSGRVGIGRFVLRSKESLVAVRPIHGALGMQTMRFHDELVAPGDLELPEMKKKPDGKQVKMAGQLVEMLSGEWEPGEHHDTYREAVLKLIEAKAGGKTFEKVEARQDDSGDDLAKALEASLAAPRERQACGQEEGSGHQGRRRRAEALAHQEARSAGKEEGVLMPRAMWTGTLSFGLVSVPVQVVSATRDMSVRFHQVRRPSEGVAAERIAMKRVAEDGEEVAWAELGKGWELPDGEMLVLTQDDLDAAAPEKTKTIDVEQFVAQDAIDPILFDHPYWLLPNGEGDGPLRAYALLVGALKGRDEVGIGRIVLRAREQLVALRERDGLLSLTTMRFADEVRDPENTGAIPGGAASEPEAEEIADAVALIEENDGRLQARGVRGPPPPAAPGADRREGEVRNGSSSRRPSPNRLRRRPRPTSWPRSRSRSTRPAATASRARRPARPRQARRPRPERPPAADPAPAAPPAAPGVAFRTWTRSCPGCSTGRPSTKASARRSTPTSTRRAAPCSTRGSRRTDSPRSR
ncbi:MAG: hypothetical protein PGN13_00790 [Patulibacter minatonensis]